MNRDELSCQAKVLPTLIIRLNFDKCIDKFAHLDFDRTASRILLHKVALVRVCSGRSGCSLFESRTAQQVRELRAWKRR